MKYQSLISGLAGSIALTVLHETFKRTVASPPRMDKLGKQGLKKVLGSAGVEMPTEDQLEKITFGGDIIGNAAYYSMVAMVPDHPVLAGMGLGLAAGIGAVILPAKIGLNEQYSNATGETQILTVMLYLAGGWIAGGVIVCLRNKNPRANIFIF